MLIVVPAPENAPLGAHYWPALGGEPGTAGHIIFWSLEAFNSWFWIIGLLYLARRFLNFSNRFLRYANDAVLPYYLIHQGAIVAVGFHIIKFARSMFLKYLMMVVGAFLLTMLLYEIIRRMEWMRFLMGMRPKKKRKIGLKSAV